ncbi:hypothetical protein BCR15_05715 [Tessaracoccus lapidicaptus]|uniref:Uncharacterized protein n=1 Tax=Tessaracoccus lapidicaptus TaxID=1427523 RepID=A0A1C0AL58_9ACTN|nr:MULTISPECIES: YesL family protein [Tessaracoccus]AQX16021.1 hypothetical protein BKM78_08905 [Tessaracoccus sp. T2.5-30]OCL33322.1 hypothetical protein BCR15_05715 [Tessaracoccus lapidicaptus]VEP40531.1 hypothetical protein TLA_TLA_01796 [Tessaracoccus lapidicaptus]
MQIDPGSRNVQGITTLLAFMALNAIYLVSCVPIVTIGVATSALYEVTMRYADEERGNLIADYFRALRANLGPATAVYLVLAVPAALLAFASAFWFSFDSPVSGGAGFLAAIGAGYFFAATLWGLAQVAAYRNALGQTLKNSLLLPVAQSIRTLGLLAVVAGCVALTVVVPGFVYIMLTLGCSLAAYGMAFIFRGAFARHS